MYAPYEAWVITQQRRKLFLIYYMWPAPPRILIISMSARVPKVFGWLTHSETYPLIGAVCIASVLAVYSSVRHLTRCARLMSHMGCAPVHFAYISCTTATLT